MSQHVSTPGNSEEFGSAIRGERTDGDALAAARDSLRQSGTSTSPELDAQVLLEHVTGHRRASLLAFPERPLDADQAGRYATLIARRARGEPVAYLTGTREFLGLPFRTDARALIPRPETELLVEAALEDIRARLAVSPSTPPVVADIGTGTGAIAVAVAALEPRLPLIYATDISDDALSLAEENAASLGVAGRIRFLRGDLLAPLPEPVDVLLANLPYVAPHDEPELPVDVRGYEPSLALYGDDDGLGHFRRLFADLPRYLRPHASFYLEFGYDQRAAITQLITATFPSARLRVHADYAGWDRFVAVHL